MPPRLPAICGNTAQHGTAAVKPMSRTSVAPFGVARRWPASLGARQPGEPPARPTWLRHRPAAAARPPARGARVGQHLYASFGQPRCCWAMKVSACVSGMPQAVQAGAGWGVMRQYRPRRELPIGDITGYRRRMTLRVSDPCRSTTPMPPTGLRRSLALLAAPGAVSFGGPGQADRLRARRAGERAPALDLKRRWPAARAELLHAAAGPGAAANTMGWLMHRGRWPGGQRCCSCCPRCSC